MYHLRKIKVLLATCLLACSSLWAQDVKISLANATAEATSDQGGNEAASSAIDGDYSKFWHSQWSWGAVFDFQSSVDLTIALSEVTLVDYVRYIPRQGSNQGHWGEVEVFYSPNTTGTSFTSVGTFNLNMADIPHDFFLNGTEGVSCGQIKFTIRSGSNNHATAAEIEMYQLDKDKLNAFAQYFTDDVYSELKSGVTSSDGIADADVKALVEAMLADNEYKKFRVGEYEAYETLGTLQQRLKTKHQYSRYENPTGVYFTAGQSYLVAVSGIEDDAVGLKVKNWYQSESSSTYSLRNGLNYITAITEGNVFVNYYTDNYAEAPKVKVHFINAPVIGYWDQETMTNSDWVALLADKASDDHRIIITQSEHAQTAFPISAWKTHCPTDVETLMGHYQNVQWAIRDMMGLEKYGYQTRNRQIFYVVNGGFMAAGAEGAFCNYSSLGGIMNPNSFDFWGVGHEWGHNNQIDPGFYWSGCGETTNNIYASWAQYHFTANRDAEGNPTVLRLEDEKSGIDEYSDMRGGRMQTYFEEAVRKGVAWQLQDGPDYHNATPGTKTVTGRDADGNDIGEVTTTSRNYDHFVKLTPFWQLNLWGNLAEKCPDIITDVIHSIRTAENYTATYNTNGKQQINWMKLACDHAGIDLLPFFEKAGMLVPIHAYIEDYGAGWNIITEEMINELKAYVAQKGYPAYTEEINYINAHNMHIYRDNLNLNVTGMQGELNGDKLIVQHSVAQNAVAFETYNAQDELIRITMYGLGSNDEHSFTQVLFPSDAAYVMAVGYDGERQMVYKVRTADELQTLISEAESLLSAVGSVNNPVAQKVELTADNYYCNALYTAEDNDDKFTSYKVLCDGNPATYLHTDYSGNAPSENHYVTIDLGSGNELTFFNLNYTTRNEGYACAPRQVTIEASNDNKTWVTLRSVTSGLNSANNAQNTIAGLGDGTPYRYIRMTVLETSTSTDYFVLSEMGLSELSYDVNLQPSYSLISTDVVVAAHLALQSAQEVVNNGTDYTTAYIALQKSVDALFAAREEMDKLNEQKASLITLIGSTNSLIAQCGTVVFNAATPDTELALQTSNESGYYYLSTNANEPQEGSLDNLIDTSDDTYFHSAWSWDVAAVHNLKVDMGEGKSLKEFTFTYKTTKGLFPTEINVYGSNDDSQGELLHTFTKDNDVLPTAVGRSWTSSVISSEAAYRYIRFEVTKSEGGGYGETPKGEYCFVMSYFGITEMAKPEGYTVTLGNEAGGVTRELMIATYEAVQEAQSVVEYANTEAQVNEAIDKLQVQYNALQEAKNAVQYVDFTISSNVAGGGVIYNEGNHTTTLTAPSTLAAGDLTAIPLDGYVAKGITVEGTTITVTYNTVYTVQVVGGNANGRAVCGDTEYADEATFDTDEALTAESVTAKPLTGYEATVTLNEETNTFTVTYRVVFDTTKYYTFNCLSDEAHNTTRFIRDNGSVINGRSAEGSLFLFEAADDVLDGYYIKSYVSDKYINHKEEEGYVYASEEKLTVWTIAIPSHTPAARTFTVGNDLYLNNNGNDDNAADGTCVDLQSNYHNGGPGSGNACSLWTLTEGTPLDKSELLALIEETNNLIGSCYTDGVLDYTNSQYVTEEYLGTIREAVEAAQAKYDSKATTESEYTATLEALRNTKTTLGEAITQADTEKEERAELQEELSALVSRTETLMSNCGDITTVPATTLSGVVALQTTQPDGNFYLSTNAQENSEGPIAGLTDDDVSTFFHSSWKTRMGEAHYLQVDMGAQYALKEFAFGYVTRDNGGGGPHPSTIVVSGSNSTDNDSFVELRVINSGLPTGGAASWETTDNIVVPGMPYRYLRFTVTQSAGTNGCKHSNPDEYFFTMSKFSITAVPTEASHHVEVKANAGIVTEAQLLEVYYEKERALSIINSANNTELMEVKEALQAKYDALNDAYTAIDKSELEALLPEVEALYNSCYTDGVFNYTGSLYVTAELMTEVEGVISAAHTALDNTVSQEEYDVALADLRNAQAELQYAVDHAWLPVILTTDIEAPVLYTIKSKRGNTKVLQYEPASDHMVSIAEVAANSAKQAFFFMEGDAATQVYVYPFAAGEQVLSADDTGNGAAKAFAKKQGDATYQQWTFEKETVDNVDYYSLKVVNGSTYFSHYGGGNNKMGFYGTKDDGSRMTFEETTIEGSGAYNSLKVYYEEAAKVASSEITGGNGVGYYPVAEADAYNTAYATATSLVTNNTSSYDEYLAAYDALLAANEALNLIMPKVGTYYTIVSACGDSRGGQLMYATGENEVKFANDKKGDDGSWIRPEALWTFTTEGYMMNLQTGCRVGASTWGGALTLVEDDAKVVSFEALTFDGQVMLKPGNGYPLHAQVSGSKIVGYSNENNASAWRIVEVEDMSSVNCAVNVGEYGHTSLYLNYPVTIPEGVKAYIIDGSDDVKIENGIGTLKLKELGGEVLPAQTAVIVEAPQGEYSFSYTTDAATDDVESNLLTGSAYVTYREAEEGHNYYIFGVGVTEGVDLDVVGLYKNFVEYTAAGVYAEEGTEDATHYRMSANKVLFDWSNSGQQVNSFRFRIDGDATGIDNIGADGNAVIYDLYGRRILEVVSSGIYIINGEKRYVHVK